jgi:hypothetical protein
MSGSFVKRERLEIRFLATDFPSSAIETPVKWSCLDKRPSLSAAESNAFPKTQIGQTGESARLKKPASLTRPSL